MSVPTPAPTATIDQPDATPVPKVANPAIATGSLAVLTSILASTGNQPFIDDNAWVVPLVIGVVGVLQFIVGYFSPRR